MKSLIENDDYVVYYFVLNLINSIQLFKYII